MSQAPLKPQPPGWTETSNPSTLPARPLVSVLVLAYNHAPYLGEALRGILSQDVREPIEVVIGVDHSTDETLAIALDHQATHPGWIRVLVPDARVGMNENFKRVYQSARGDFVAVCEGDDVWTEGRKLQTQIEVLRAHPDVSLVFHDVSVINARGERIAESKIRDYWGLAHRRSYEPPDLATGAAIPTLSIVFRRVPVVFDGIMRVVNVDTFLFAILGQHGSARQVDGLMGEYRLHGGGTWSAKSKEEKMASTVRTFTELSRELRADLRPYSTVTLGRASLGYATHLLRQWRLVPASRYVWTYVRGFFAIAVTPLSHRTKCQMLAEYLAIFTTTARRALLPSRSKE